MTDRLKPCPFCGGELKKDRWGFYVHGRNDCILTGFEVEPEEEEIEKWNTRKPMDRIVQELEVEMLTEDENRKDCLWVKDWEGTRYHRARFAAFNRANEIVKEGGKDVTTRNDTGMD